MSLFKIRKGRDIPLKGKADKNFVDCPCPPSVAVQPQDFRGLKPRLTVKLDNTVKVGTPIIVDKALDGVKILSSVSGRVSAINRGAKRFLLEVVVESDGKQDKESFRSFSESELENISKEDLTKALLDGGLWPTIRQRPFSKIANPSDTPKSIFVHAMNTEPLAADIDFILEGREKQFQIGLDALKKLTQGNVYLCYDTQAQSKALTQAATVEAHQFSGPHPAGNVGTHVHHIDPVYKGEFIWFVEVQDVLRIATLLTEGIYPAERIVAVTGEKAKNRLYAKTIMGAPFASLLPGSDLTDTRCLTGSVLAGRDVGPEGYLGFYDSQITVIPQGGHRELIGWLLPGVNKFTFSKAFASSFLPPKEVSLDTDKNGSDRAIVLNHLFDLYNALDIITYFLLKAILGGDIEEAEKLGILECDEEDFALCTFACPSKTDVGGIIREGLDVIEKEG